MCVSDVTFILQAALAVGLALGLAVALQALVLQQRLLSLQLPQTGLQVLSAAHLKNQSLKTLFNTSYRAAFTLLRFHNSLYKKWLLRIRSELNTNPIPVDVLMWLLEFSYCSSLNCTGYDTLASNRNTGQ